eukprot:COSAG01_NODE_13036_length_1645_cov_6.152652_2_plen_87_part_00
MLCLADCLQAYPYIARRVVAMIHTPIQVTSGEGKTTMQKCLLGFGVLAALLMVKTISDMATRTLAEAGVTGSKGDSTKRNKSKKKA